jgi:peptide/nickel transport system substrate-binding protein
MSRSKKIMIAYLLLFLASSCNNDVVLTNEVVVHELNDPIMLNPCNTADATSLGMANYIFQKLIDFDFKNPNELVPILAEARPTIEKNATGQMLLTFNIRPEAHWSNGSPITAKDIEFTLKTILNPLVNNQNIKSLFSYINDFIFYPDNIKKFTVVSNETFFQAETEFVDIFILPEYLYDPKGLMSFFTVKMISEKSDSIKTSPQLKEFADDFNSEKRMRSPDFIEGSGPYRLTDWKTNERITFTKKENWWGDEVQNKNCYFEAYPDKLIFQTIKDQTAAMVSLKAGNLDLMRSIKVKDFVELPQSEKFTKNFVTYTPMEYSFAYIGLNSKSPLLTDNLIRQALAHIIDVDDIIKTVKYGQAERIIGPIHPSKKRAYNSNISPYEHNLEKAKALLEKAGWKNTNEDETVDKTINGKKTELILNFVINANDERKAIALMFKEEAKKVGITLNISVLDWAVFMGKCINHEFDVMYFRSTSGPPPDDLKQMFYTERTNGDGSNFCNFSNTETDVLIDSIRVEIDEVKRNKMYLRIQKILHEEVPMIFLFAPTEHIAISKKFENAYPSIIAPGYWLPGFRLKQSYYK